MKAVNIYKPLTAFLFLAAVLAQTFSRTFVIADYYTNTAKYALNCENKTNPEMHCYGKCQMMKKLKAEEKKDKENPERKSENNSDLPFSSKSFFASIELPEIELSSSAKFPSSSNGHAVDRSFGIFHPPRPLS